MRSHDAAGEAGLTTATQVIEVTVVLRMLRDRASSCRRHNLGKREPRYVRQQQVFVTKSNFYEV